MTNALSDDALDLIFRDARTYNGWLDKDVTEEQIHQLYDLLKMGPTSANQQPARFVWCKSAEAKARLAKHASGTNAEKLVKSPVCVIIGLDEDFHEQLPWLFPHTDAKSWFVDKPDLRKSHALRNSSLQGAYLIIAARALGLDCGPMSGFDEDGVTREFFADQPSVKANFLCSIGYGDPASIFDRSPRPAFETFNRVI